MACSKPRFNPDPRLDPSALLLSLLLFLLCAFSPCEAAPPNPARPPLLSGQPFIIFWGMLDSSCSSRPDPRTFGMERERVAVFYEDSLGSYPYFLDKSTAVSRGLPQHTRLNAHVQKVQQDLDAALPAPRYLGLGVLRWAEWVPQWSRNRDKQTMYRDASRKLMRNFFPKWAPEEVEKWAKVDFEAAAQSLMMETLREVKRLRPKALWGFSPYPVCSSSNNNEPTQTALNNYTGRCSPAETALNDQLLWLWRRCSALYPLLTLEKSQSGTPASRLLLSSLIGEALRVSSLPGSNFDLPVFPLLKSVYTSSKTFLSQTDLVNTIGESAAMGTAGIVIWDKSETKTERECQDLAEFVRKVLGPYSLNITAATQLCSTSLCQGRGRCVRQNPDSSTYLHLPPLAAAARKVTEKAEAAKVTVQPDSNSEAPEQVTAEMWKRDFQCQWYKAAGGDVSDQQAPRDGASVRVKAEGDSGTAIRTVPAPAPKSASDGKAAGTDSPGAGSQTLSLETQSDSGTGPPTAPKLMMLLLLLLGAGSFCLGP